MYVFVLGRCAFFSLPSFPSYMCMQVCTYVYVFERPENLLFVACVSLHVFMSVCVCLSLHACKFMRVRTHLCTYVVFRQRVHTHLIIYALTYPYVHVCMQNMYKTKRHAYMDRLVLTASSNTFLPVSCIIYTYLHAYMRTHTYGHVYMDRSVLHVSNNSLMPISCIIYTYMHTIYIWA